MSRRNSSAEYGTVAEYIKSLKESPAFGSQVVHHEEIAARQAFFRETGLPLPPGLESALKAQGISRLYTHQARAVDLVRAGKDVVVATPTASGKSLIYNLPVFAGIIEGKPVKALYLFPLKALAQDQLRAIDELGALLPVGTKVPRGAICDGDTSSHHRRKIRDNPPDILITNPDMLHLSMLGYHDRWSGLWQGLTHVIIDEVHTYRGIFGSHMAWVLRRLARICRHYGSAPVYVLSSATVGNPGELAANLLGREIEVITESGSPAGGRHFLFLDPREGASGAVCQLLEAAIKRGLRTIVYTQSRKMTELIYVWTRARIGELAPKLTSYRAGFLPEERREIEARLSDGSLLGVISTSALELGIDIGELDLCILAGYPGSVMATLQRGGRVGRRHRDSLVVLVGHEDALDQYFMRHPTDFFRREVEAAVLNPENTEIMKRHLICAAAEMPLRVESRILDGEAVQKAVAELRGEGLLLQSAEGKIWYTVRKYPHREVDLRGSGRSLAIRVDSDNTLLGRADWVRCLKECHPGAVYLHRGATWVVNSLDLEGLEVRVVRKDVNYFTRPMANKDTEILAFLDRVKISSSGDHAFTVGFGRLRVTDEVTGFQRKLVRGHQVISTEKLDLPPIIFETEGLWLEIPEGLKNEMENEQRHFMGGIHALEHALIGIFPLLVLCDRNDVGGIAYPWHPQLQNGAVFIYDGHPGGVGLCRQAFSMIGKLLDSGRATISECPCEVGCPSCVHSPKCGSGNRPIDKAAALRLLDGLLGTNGGVSVERLELPDGGERIEVVDEPAMPVRYGVFDVETRRSAAEVGGWHKAEKMGVSIVVLYDSGPDEFFVYRDDEIGDLVARLQELDLVIGFNNKRFDNRVLSAYTAFDLGSLPTLDILEEVKNRLGYRLSLDHLAGQTLGVEKSADGLMALKWYKEGRIDLIIEYCRKDVEITRDIYLYGLENEYLLFKNKAGSLVRCPVRFGIGAG
ncbi:MAG: DEAD/DEAH box helicase [Proteobacteria bacterium]|nr:DEAD/DEAH box helicase [Pseudomonadota bacterium]MBU1739699.1 DEAD/DEAH box helicase [Pseudomonadota bacterium]